MNKQPRKGQTSLDFMMTYGWALLLVVVVVSSLFALGVFNAGSFLGPRATGFAQVGVLAWNVNAAGVLALRLQNFAGMDINVINIEATYGASHFPYDITNVSIPNGKISDTFTVGAISNLAPGQYYTMPLRITYTDFNGFNYTETGTISGTVGAGAVPPLVRINSPHSNSVLDNRTINISVSVWGNNLTSTDISIINESGVVDSITIPQLGTYSVLLNVTDDGVYNITALAHYSDGGSASATASSITVNTTSQQPQLQCPSEMVSYWRAEDSANDAMGLNNGSLNGVAFASGRAGQAFSFDGVNDEMTVPANPNLIPSSELTIELWVKTTTGGSLATKHQSGYGNGYIFYINNDGALAVYVSGATADSGLTHVNDDAWHHIAVSYNSSSLELYIDGVSIASASGVGSITDNNEQLTIGSFGIVPGVPAPAFYSGLMDELAVYNRSLTESEIQQHYAAGLGDQGYCNASSPQQANLSVSITAPASDSVLDSRTVTVNFTASGTDLDRTNVSVWSVRKAVDNYVWAANSVDNTVSRINKSTNAVIGSPIGVGSHPIGVAVDQDSVWVANFYDNTVSRINKTTNTVIANITVGTLPQGVAVDQDSVWVTNYNDDTVSRINKADTSDVTTIYGLGSVPHGVAVDQDSVWATNPNSNTVSRINKTTNTNMINITVGATPIGAAVDQDSVWVANYGSNTVSRINKTTNTIITNITVGSYPTGVAVDQDSVWVANFYADSVSRINKTNTSDVTTIDGVGSNPNGVAVDQDSVWVINYGDSTISRINKSTNAVIGSPIGIGSSSTGSFGDATGYEYDMFFSNTPVNSTVVPTTSSGDYSATLDVPSDGVYDITATAYDSSGNSASSTVSNITVSSPVQLEACGTGSTAGMVSYWRAEDNSLDSFSGNDGAPNGAVSYAAGRAGQAFSLDGSGYLTVPGSPSLDMTDAITIEAWINPTTDFNNGILYKGPFNSAQGIYSLSVSSGYPAVFIINSGLQLADWGASPLTTGQWHHVVGTYDRSDMKLYIDGALNVQMSATDAINVDGNSLIIGNYYDSSYGFNGLVDEVAIYNRSLTESEIQQHYAAGLGGQGYCAPAQPPQLQCVQPPSGLVAWWPGEDNATDIIGGFDGTPSSSGVTYAAGEVGQAFSLYNGAVYADSPFATPSTGTVSAWVYETGQSQYQDNIFDLDRDTSGGLRFYIDNRDGRWGLNTNSQSESLSVTPGFSMNEWHHFVVTWDGQTNRLYLDGTERANASSAFLAYSSRNLAIGNLWEENYPNPEYFAFDGLIDEVQIYGRALSDSEIQQIYDAGSAGVCRPEPVTHLSDCGNISYPGNYALTGNIGNSTGGTCLTITANDVILDCNGSRITGITNPDDRGGTGYGVYVGGNNSAIRDCTIWGFRYGIYLDSSSGSIVSNVSSSQNECVWGSSSDCYGIYLSSSDNNTISNVTANQNYGGNGGSGGNGYGIYLTASSDNQLEGITVYANGGNYVAGNGYGIALESGSDRNTISDINATYNFGWPAGSTSGGYGIYLSSSDDNTISNVTAELQPGASGYGYGIYLTASSNNSFINGTASSNWNTGIYLTSSSSGNSIADINASSNTGQGILLESGSDRNTIANSTFNSNGDSGIQNYGSSNIITNNVASFNNIGGSECGITVYYGASDNIIANNTFESDNTGIAVYQGSNNTIANNTIISNSGYGINLWGGTNANNVFNNLFNNSNDVSSDGSPNYWNTTLDCSPGTSNIIGGGCIGGNFWADSSGTGWSEVSSSCNANSSGICSSPYTIASGNVDELPLTNLTPPPPTELSGCGNISYSGNYVLAGDVGNSGTCFTIEANDVTLDCNGSTITGSDNSPGNFGIDNSAGHSYITVKNCNITGFIVGVYFAGASHGAIENNTASSNGAYGIALFYSSDYNTIANNTATSNAAYGIIFWPSCDNNIIYNNDVSSNNAGISLQDHSDNNLVANNTVSNNNGGDGDGIEINWYTTNNTVVNNTVTNNSGSGIWFATSSDTLVYNNFFNNSANTYVDSGSTNNFWNTTLDCSPGTTNIIGGGCIGGNYWATPTGTGWSETPSDCNANSSGICTSSYTIASSNVDELPLTNLTPPPIELSGCGNISYSGDYVLTDDVGNSGTCFTIEANDATLDCNGSTITGSGGSGNGVDNTAGHSHVTVKNCNITGFYNGIEFDGASYGDISNNDASSNSYFDIYLSSSSNSIIADNTANSGLCGIRFDSSSNNTLFNNTANGNGYRGFDIESSSYNNIFANNTASNNGQTGIFLYSDANNNTVVNNTACSNTDYFDIWILVNSIGNTGDNTCNTLSDEDSNDVTCSIGACP